MKKFYLAAMVLTTTLAVAQNSIPTVSVYSDCRKNGYTKSLLPTGSAAVSSTSGRDSCEYVQLWENGPQWATFNVGATITDYANLTTGTDATSGNVAYYNTANVGGLYPWNNPNLNGRLTTWTGSSAGSGIADVATTLWGSNWKTPTEEQLDSLQNSTYTTWTWCDGSTTQYVKGCTLKGYKVTGKGDYAKYSIFLPAAGSFNFTWGRVEDVGYEGYYWSSPESIDVGIINHLWFDSGRRDIRYRDQGNGLSVRAVFVNLRKLR